MQDIAEKHPRMRHIGPAILSHQVITLEDGHRVGITVGGHGVPLVFLHGIAMNRFAYEEVLTRLARSGFLVIAIDAPGHGDTDDLLDGNDTWETRVAFMHQVFEELGVRRTILVGHSMGGRKAIALAATKPGFAAAAVLVSSATGAGFDRYKTNQHGGRVHFVRGMLLALYDTVAEQVELRGPGPGWGLSLVRRMVKSTMRNPTWFFDVVRSIVRDTQGADHLDAVRTAELPVFVLHGRRDQVIRYGSAVSVAEAVGGLLIELPRARHSWLIGSPQTFGAVMEDLLYHELGEAVRAASGATTATGTHGEPQGWMDPSGKAYQAAGPPTVSKRSRKRRTTERPPLHFVRCELETKQAGGLG